MQANGLEGRAESRVVSGLNAEALKIARVERADGAGILIGMTVDLLIFAVGQDKDAWIEKMPEDPNGD